MYNVSQESNKWLLRDYTAVPWESNIRYCTDFDVFLIIFVNEHDLEYTKYSIRQWSEQLPIYVLDIDMINRWENVNF